MTVNLKKDTAARVRAIQKNARKDYRKHNAQETGEEAKLQRELALIRKNELNG
jgi:hypothetical protein